MRRLVVHSPYNDTARNNNLQLAKCRYADCCDLFIVILNVIMLSVILLIVIMLNVVMLNDVMLSITVVAPQVLNVSGMTLRKELFIDLPWFHNDVFDIAMTISEI